jgi:DNA-binding transcriptional LysR family regulator
VVASLCTNDTEAETQAVLAGLGIGQLGSFSAALHIRNGLLVPLLVQHVTQREAIYIYYGHRTEQPLRVRTFIDFMVTRIAGNKNFYFEPSELRSARGTRAVRRADPASGRA